MPNVPDDQGVRLGYGDLDDSDRLAHTRITAWTQYLNAAAEVEPEIIASITSPETVALWRQTPIDKRNRVDIALGKLDDDRSFAAFFRAWCARWGFNADYAYTPFFNTVSLASDAQSAGKAGPWSFASDARGFPLDTQGLREELGRKALFAFVHESGEPLAVDWPQLYWNPTRETKRDAFLRIMSVIEPLIETDLGEIRDAYLANGHEPVRIKRTALHYEWFARYQLKGERLDEIVASLTGEQSRNTRSVERALTDVAHLLGVKKRQGRPGRPKGSKLRH